MKLPEFSDYGRGRVVETRAIAAEQALVTVDPRDDFAAAHTRAGQFCKMRVDGEEGIFAMFSAPGETPLRFLVRVGNPDGGEAADRLAELEAGAEVGITLPAGTGFDLDRARGRDVYFVATGTGVAPVRAAIEQVLRERTAYGVLALDHGVRSAAHLAIGDDIERWRRAGVEIHVCYSEIGDDGALCGETVQDALRGRGPDFANAAVVAVGQPAMLESLLSQVVALGGDPELFLKNI